MFLPSRKATPELLALRQASRELHERHGLRDVHYEAAHELRDHDERRERQLEKANDAPSTSPAI